MVGALELRMDRRWFNLLVQFGRRHPANERLFNQKWFREQGRGAIPPAWYHDRASLSIHDSHADLFKSLILFYFDPEDPSVTELVYKLGMPIPEPTIMMGRSLRA